jgi:hypothetical protein
MDHDAECQLTGIEMEKATGRSQPWTDTRIARSADPLSLWGPQVGRTTTHWSL